MWRTSVFVSKASETKETMARPNSNRLPPAGQSLGCTSISGGERLDVSVVLTFDIWLVGTDGVTAGSPYCVLGV